MLMAVPMAVASFFTVVFRELDCRLRGKRKLRKI
jgi:hypothetical protein